MRESVTKFDFEAAFKALDEIEVPKAEKGIASNRAALTEIFSRKSKFDALIEEYEVESEDITSVEQNTGATTEKLSKKPLKEEYYDIDTNGLSDAKDARDAEIAQAKLARIEKIVDLDADSAEDLLTSYVGKYIMQCPQCMTLFYKDQADVEASEEDPNTVNVNEVCQHCGNDSGYTLVGKVGEAVESSSSETSDTENDLSQEPDPEIDEKTSDDTNNDEELDFDLDAIDFNEESVEEEPTDEENEESDKKEEALQIHDNNDLLVEELDNDIDLDTKLAAHNEYIDYLRTTISQEESALNKASNEQVKAAIQRRIEASKEDLEKALPDAIKSEVATTEVTPDVQDKKTTTQEESYHITEQDVLTEALQDEANLDVSADEFKQLISSPEFKKPISDTAVRAMLNSDQNKAVDNDNIKTEDLTLDEGIFSDLKDKFLNTVDSIASKLKSREDKANWILHNAVKNPTTAELLDNNGKLVPDEQDLKFSCFIVKCFKNTYSHGRNITMAPSLKSLDLLVLADKQPESTDDYAKAEKFAKGYSAINGNGPAFIFMAKDEQDPEAVFLCQFFNGKLEYDQLEKYFKLVKEDLKSIKSIRDSGLGQIASEPKEGQVEEAVTTNKSKINTIFEDLEELQESSLEALISNSLIESYKNVAGFRLCNCAYSSNNQKFIVEGLVHFVSGNSRKISYIFSEAYTNGTKITFKGINEKLGSNKTFNATGYIKNKMFITESFN